MTCRNKRHSEGRGVDIPYRVFVIWLYESLRKRLQTLRHGLPLDVILILPSPTPVSFSIIVVCLGCHLFVRSLNSV